MPAKKISNAEAADVLGVYESEVASVAGDVATTTDGQRYRLGSARGEWEWLKADGSAVPAPPTEVEVTEPSE